MLYASLGDRHFEARNRRDERKRGPRRSRRPVHRETDRGIAVVAENTWAAIKGRCLAVEWSDPPPDAFDSDSHRKKLEEAARAPANITRKEEAPADTPPVSRTIEAIYSIRFYAHAPVETMNCVADVKGDRCTIWAPTQAPTGCRNRWRPARHLTEKSRSMSR